MKAASVGLLVQHAGNWVDMKVFSSAVVTFVAPRYGLANPLSLRSFLCLVSYSHLADFVKLSLPARKEHLNPEEIAIQ